MTLVAVVGVVLLLVLCAPVEAFYVPTTSGISTPPLQRRLGKGGRSTPSFSSSTTSTLLVSTTSTASSSTRWDAFDYLQHWYAVSWVDDLIPNCPEKITLFDVDYAVVHDGDATVMAFVDQCPHRKAALSEGRLTTGTGTNKYLQCAYHGWSFAANGTCVDIPQSEATRTNLYSPKSCATAIPARIHQGLIWLWPGPQQTSYPEPPSIAEMDDPRFKINKAVRDFPMIDYSLLLSNILDPDHGLFAHQSVPFDMYMANAAHPLTVTQEFPHNGAGWILRSRVPAVSKLLLKQKQENDKNNKGPSDPSIMATSTFWAPTTVALCRRNAQNETNFVTAFWVVPTGVGKSRFLSAAVGRLPFTVPRWFQHIMLNAFLDQDSLLVASQQPAVLQEEARQVQQELVTTTSDAKSTTQSPVAKTPWHMTARQDLFCYQSPTDKAVAVLDQFWDATLARTPNRVAGLLRLAQTGALEQTMDRTTVLDRETQHLNICPDSQGFVRNCRRIQILSWTMAAGWALLFRKQQSWLRFCRSWIWPIASVTIGWVVHRLRQCFYYTYTKDTNFHKLSSNIPKLWNDPH